MTNPQTPAAPGLSVEQVRHVLVGDGSKVQLSFDDLRHLVASHESLRAQVEALTRENALLSDKVKFWQHVGDSAEQSLSALTALRPQIEQAHEDCTNARDTWKQTINAPTLEAGQNRLIELLRSLLDLIPRGEEA